MFLFLKTIFRRSLMKITGNYLLQKLLEYIVIFSQSLMGIGSGSGVKDSGEIALIKALKRLANINYCIFDVGANIGQFAFLLLENLGKNDFAIHCFEPSSFTFQRLQNNFKNNKHIRLNNFGLGKEPGELTLYYDEPGSGLASLTRRKLDHCCLDFDKSEVVMIDTVDNYCSQHNISQIDLLKIDVEGHEFDVLNGGDRMFKCNSIKMVSFEFGGCNIDTKTFFQDFYYFFKDKRFALYRITPSGYIHSIPAYKEVYEQFRTTNFLAINNNDLK